MIVRKRKINSVEEQILVGFFYENPTFNWSISKPMDGSGELELGVFFEDETDLSGWDQMVGECPFLGEGFETSIVNKEDWCDEYKKYLKPWECEMLHWIPAWEKSTYEIPQGHIGVYINAGMAFGTGAHETTRLCAQYLVDYINQRNHKLEGVSVVDAGCGSGILAISAKQLGLNDIMAFDFDPDVEGVFYENLKENSLPKLAIDFQVGSVEHKLEGCHADLIFANIETPILCRFNEQLIDAVKVGGWLVMSGILTKELDIVKDCFKQYLISKWKDYSMESSALGEWASLKLVREN